MNLLNLQEKNKNKKGRTKKETFVQLQIMPGEILKSKKKIEKKE